MPAPTRTCTIDGIASDAAAFDAKLTTLIIDARPISSAPLVEPDGGPGGIESTWEARDPQTGARWQLLIVESPARGGGRHVHKALVPEPAELLRMATEQGLWGTETLVVRADGTAALDFTPVEPGSTPAAHRRRRLTAAQLAEVQARLRAAPAGDVAPGRSGVPDEAEPRLDVWLDGQHRVLRAWDGEWAPAKPGSSLGIHGNIVADVKRWLRAP